MIYPDTITVVRAKPVTDPYSGEQTGKDWTNATRVAYSRVQVQSAQSVEPDGSGSDVGRDKVVSGWNVYTAPGVRVDVTARDHIEWDGTDGPLEVDGDIGVWNSPITGAFHHQQFRLKRVAG